MRSKIGSTESISQSSAKILLTTTNECYSLINILNKNSNRNLMIQTNILSSEEALKTFLRVKKLEGLNIEAISKKQTDQALIQGQRHLFAEIGNDFSRLKQIDLKNVIGIGINGTESVNSLDCYLGLRKHNLSKSYKLSIGHESRQIKDQLFSEVALNLIICFVKQTSLTETLKEHPNVSIIQQTKQILITQNESILLPSMFVNPPLRNVSIFSGSFNPFHLGHYEIFQQSLTHPLVKNTPIIFELTTKNADKQANNNIQQRIKSIISFFKKELMEGQNIQEDHNYIVSQLLHHNIQVLVSSKGLFVQKQLHEGCFIIGADTYIRLFDLKFYENNPMKLKRTIAKFVTDDARFLVFNRKNKQSGELEQIPDHGIQYSVVEGWSNDISSTSIRQHSHI